MDEINSKLYIFEEEWNKLEMAMRNIFRLQDRGQKDKRLRKVQLKDMEDSLRLLTNISQEFQEKIEVIAEKQSLKRKELIFLQNQKKDMSLKS